MKYVNSTSNNLKLIIDLGFLIKSRAYSIDIIWERIL